MIVGTHPTLLNVTYFREDKDRNQEEMFEVIYKDDNGIVRRSEEPPNVDIYVVKPEFRTYTYNKPEERIERMDQIICPFSQVRNEIAKAAGDYGKNLMRRAYQERKFKLLDQLYKWPYAYHCDFQPEYYFMKQWYQKYPLGNVKLTKSFMDIEVDMIDYNVMLDDIPNTAYAPVNLITIIFDDGQPESWTFVLIPKVPSRNGRTEEEYKQRYQLYERQLAAHQNMMSNYEGLIKRLHGEFDSTYGYCEYHVRDFENEIDLIANAFRIINERKPNYCLMWNMRFDIQYLYERIKALGYNPASIICHPDFKNPRCYFKLDRSTFMLEKQFDFFYCSSYTQYICQMRLYASIRKSQHKLKSVSLNAIAERELRDRKVEYPDESNIITFPYMDWMRFVIYNIKDVKLQVGIERKCKDLMTYYMRSHSNLTPYAKIFKETHLLRNVREMYFERNGWVQSNNINIIGDIMTDEEKRFYGSQDDEESSGGSYKGAINAEPSWNDFIGMEIFGVPSNNVFKNPMDYDMGAFYPSIKIASNMDSITLLYKASFDNDEFISGEMPNRSLNTTYRERDKNNKERMVDNTGEAVNTYVSGNILTFGYNYMNLPSITVMEQIVCKAMASQQEMVS